MKDVAKKLEKITEKIEDLAKEMTEQVIEMEKKYVDGEIVGDEIVDATEQRNNILKSLIKLRSLIKWWSRL